MNPRKVQIAHISGTNGEELDRIQIEVGTSETISREVLQAVTNADWCLCAGDAIRTETFLGTDEVRVLSVN